MIESMSAGTPVVAWREGSVPEVMKDGASGFIVASIEEAVAAVHRASFLDRQAVRSYFESRFTARRMAKNYIAAYQKVVSTDDDDNSALSHLASSDSTRPIAAE